MLFYWHCLIIVLSRCSPCCMLFCFVMLSPCCTWWFPHWEMLGTWGDSPDSQQWSASWPSWHCAPGETWTAAAPSGTLPANNTSGVSIIQQIWSPSPPSLWYCVGGSLHICGQTQSPWIYHPQFGRRICSEKCCWIISQDSLDDYYLFWPNSCIDECWGLNYCGVHHG